MPRRILFTGGGTLGPVTPLLAVAEEWRRRESDVDVAWIGTPRGPERLLVESAKIAFYPLASPKFDRTRMWTLPIVPFFFVVSCLRARSILRTVRPDVVFTAGAYVSVPVVVMAWLMRIPVWVHQLDVSVGLANKLMAPFARRISVTWEESLPAFPAAKTEVVGAMVRPIITAGDKQAALDRYGLDAAKPTVFVLGGGTGAASINEAMAIIGTKLLEEANVIHLTGRGKMLASLLELGAGYIALEFLGDGIADAYAAADIVVNRAGMGTISEIVALGKPAICIPIHDSDSEVNAKALEERRAAEVLWYMTPQTLLQAIQKLLDNKEKRDELAKNIRAVFPLNAAERIVHEAAKIITPV